MLAQANKTTSKNTTNEKRDVTFREILERQGARFRYSP